MLLLFATIGPAFRVLQAKASGTIRILSDGTISPPGAPITTPDKITYVLTADIMDSISVERSNILINGGGYTVTGDGSGNGFSIINVNNVTIENANIHRFTYGIYSEMASSTIIRTNNITANAYDGIGLFYCIAATLQDNKIANNEYDGIEIYNSSNNNVNRNHIAANAWYGIGIYEYSTGNVSENRIEDNYNGIELSYSSQNRIFHNYFNNHTLHASTQFSSAMWDDNYPSGGNYWSDYLGNDIYSGQFQNETGSDGIGDTPYNIDENNLDRYPLMRPWTNILVASIVPSKTVAGRGFSVYIDATTQNRGWSAVTTNLTVFANMTLIGAVNNAIISSYGSLATNFTWNTNGFSYGNYAISAYAQPVLGETLVGDNNLTGWVILTIPGDVNGDSTVNIIDAIVMGNSFLATPDKPPPYWNPNADINSDNVVNILDAIVMGIHFLEHYS